MSVTEKQVPASRTLKKRLFQHTSKTTQTVRQRYLDYLEKDVRQRLKASIHEAVFLDIGMDEKLNATLPWYYVALEEKQQFAAFDEAFLHYEGRVLLLGSPGSGKTTTLLNLALKLIEEAQQDETLPIPLLYNLSKFGNTAEKVSPQLNWLHKKKDADEDNPGRLFEQWLIQMLIDMPVDGLNRQTARQWIDSANVALLLDGLDEVSDSYVLSLAEILNKTYFREHPDQTVVVCSRIIEYQPLQENKEARLRLNGAVVLQPPTREQINSYLEAADALVLRDALLEDEVLYEMAQTPLILSMMTLAYGGMAPTDIPHDLPFLERRRKLLDTYVERMVQRTARRAHGVPFDLNPDHDVPHRYPEKHIIDYLVWLAI
jgi:predicted NACHT family NTPase